MGTVLDQVRALDSFQAVRLVEHLSQELAEELELESLLAATPPELLEIGLKNAPALGARASDALSPGDSVAVARVVLDLLATDPATTPIVVDALATYRDDKMLAAEILSLGAAMSMVIVACTTTFNFRGKRLSIAKKTASPELVKTVGKVFGPAQK